jgi:hypothetical protein
LSGRTPSVRYIYVKRSRSPRNPPPPS